MIQSVSLGDHLQFPLGPGHIGEISRRVSGVCERQKNKDKS